MMRDAVVLHGLPRMTVYLLPPKREDRGLDVLERNVDDAEANPNAVTFHRMINIFLLSKMVKWARKDRRRTRRENPSRVG